MSEHSIQSEWVMTEIRKARETEKNEKRRKLFPIRLTDVETLRDWACFDAEWIWCHRAVEKRTVAGTSKPATLR